MEPLERNLQKHPLAGLLWERQSEDAQLELGWEKIPNWECMFVHKKQGLFLSVCVEDDIKKSLEESRKWLQCGKMYENVEIDGPISFLDHENLGCTSRECKPNETINERKPKMFESRTSAGAAEESPGWRKPHAQTLAWHGGICPKLR